VSLSTGNRVAVRHHGQGCGTHRGQVVLDFNDNKICSRECSHNASRKRSLKLFARGSPRRRSGDAAGSDRRLSQSLGLPFITCRDINLGDPLQPSTSQRLNISSSAIDADPSCARVISSRQRLDETGSCRKPSAIPPTEILLAPTYADDHTTWPCAGKNQAARKALSTGDAISEAGFHRSMVSARPRADRENPQTGKRAHRRATGQ